jgi:RimJ/RimL family protein N-acetyltransferase
MKEFPYKYRVLSDSVFVSDRYSIVPIRYDDRFDIMRWRNEQIYHLRQSRPLAATDQEFYFQNIISKLFDCDQPDQLLFSYLEDDKCIGYGGLVHINWLDKNAEISFIMETALEEKHFREHWGIYLSLIEKVAFEELNLHKIYTYAFDLRPRLYDAIEGVGYKKEAILKEHCYFNNEFKNVVIHSKLNPEVSLRHAVESDVQLTFEWVNDKSTRENSFSSEPIPFETHKKWWKAKMDDKNSLYLIAEIKGQPAGIVRFDKKEDSDNYTIGINIGCSYRGLGLSHELLKRAWSSFFDIHDASVEAYIKQENIPSIKSFEKAGFQLVKETEINGSKAFKYQLTRR